MDSKLTTWHGLDASKTESLFVYGCLARYALKNKAYNVIYRHPYILGNWESKWITEEEVNDFLQEDWFNKNGFFDYVGISETEWIKSQFIRKVHDLISWECAINFFGDSYDKGMDTKEVCKKVRIAYNKSYDPN